MFFKQDILATEGRDGGWVVFLITPRAIDFMAQRIKRLWNDVAIKTLPGDLRVVYLSEKRGKLLHRYLDNQTLDIYFASQKWLEISYEVVEMHARSMADEARAHETTRLASEYFTPLIDAAIEARDKALITKLINQIPCSMRVEKACIINNLMYAHFPELRQEGVTLQNWVLVE